MAENHRWLGTIPTVRVTSGGGMRNGENEVLHSCLVMFGFGRYVQGTKGTPTEAPPLRSIKHTFILYLKYSINANNPATVHTAHALGPTSTQAPLARRLQPMPKLPTGSPLAGDC